MKHLFLIFIGGGFGSVLRFVIAKALNQSVSTFPFGTLLVNVLGSFIIGLLMSYFAKNELISENYSSLLAIGFCGGFTTFSSFAYENQILLKSGDFTSFALYSIGSIVLGFLAVFAGMYCIKFI